MHHLVLLTHADLGEALLHTAQEIFGQIERVRALSSSNRNPHEILRDLESIHDSLAGDDGLVIAVDLKGGNTWNIACRLAHERERVYVISGVNLAMVLSFLMKGESLSLDELVRTLKEDGSRSLVVYEKS